MRKKGFRGDVTAVGMTALSVSDALPGGLTACGGPRPRGPCLRGQHRLGGGVSAVISLTIGTRFVGCPKVLAPQRLESKQLGLLDEELNSGAPPGQGPHGGSRFRSARRGPGGTVRAA